MGFVGDALEGLGLVGSVACGRERLRRSWRGWSRHRARGLGEVQDDKEPNECTQDELRDKMM